MGYASIPNPDATGIESYRCSPADAPRPYEPRPARRKGGKAPDPVAVRDVRRPIGVERWEPGAGPEPCTASSGRGPGPYGGRPIDVDSASAQQQKMETVL